ncbi:unnamed protein product [Rotaria sordida]|uniref:Uncharacterized protein n=1 Tax=Rotaria sordida TaxID=392033 RepID=A0A814YW25_9BILA|nr:unnamed protein product [Rotaria sordida]
MELNHHFPIFVQFQAFLMINIEIYYYKIDFLHINIDKKSLIVIECSSLAILYVSVAYISRDNVRNCSHSQRISSNSRKRSLKFANVKRSDHV